MARNQTRRIRPQILQEDRNAFASLKSITAYSPPNNAYSVASIAAVETVMDNAREAEAQAQAALDAARDNGRGC